ncbi:hypothetical protein FBU59_001675 [Linderina macrospora]|uniref:Uncharacterized protein n=1 Tax=Linderina macrospora TaxID=4868 RepID=A0ACC1JD96_9FUNG|nr:hypothetical protein FBU59_001675 [Linderina macrospora]
MSAVQRPLVITEERSKEISVDEVEKKLGKFLTNEAGLQAAPSGTSQQLQLLLEGIIGAASGADKSGDDDDDE